MICLLLALSFTNSAWQHPVRKVDPQECNTSVLTATPPPVPTMFAIRHLMNVIGDLQSVEMIDGCANICPRRLSMREIRKGKCRVIFGIWSCVAVIPVASAMVPPVLYHTPASPCSRGALLVARAVGVKVEVREIDLFAGEHLREDFVRLNPLHTIPTLDDAGFVVADSHAIATYLADKYSKNENLYPKDVHKRSLVDQRLYFDNGFLYTRLKDICFPVFFLNENTISEEKKQRVNDALEWLEGYLKPTGWVAGDNLTIADCMCVSSVTTIMAEGFDVSKYPHIQTWLEKCRKTIPDFAAVDDVGAEQFKTLFKNKLNPGQI